MKTAGVQLQNLPDAQTFMSTVAEIKDIYFSPKWYLGNFPGYFGKYSQRIFDVMK
ncbi:hypothetical protein [Treponema sp.]|jgi:hypothetical protein|uniref:hypothetical protein n=1 Tax=Treponema sp. TaxID=166 RepID=UPI00257A6BB1|nr:hypothetical protein [Treponema sp.]